MASPMLFPGVHDAPDGLPADLRRRRGDARAPSDFARRHGLEPPVRIAAQAMTTDTPSTFEAHDMMRAGRLRHGARRRRPGLRRGRHRPRGRRRGRAARLLHAERADHLRGAGPVPGGRRREVHRRRRQHLRRQGRHQSVGRPAVQGPPARRHRPGAVLRADPAAARHGRARGRSTARALALQHNLGLGGACVVTLYRGD